MRCVGWIATIVGLALSAAVPAGPVSKGKQKPRSVHSARELTSALSAVKAQIHEKKVEIRAKKRVERRITNEIEVVETRLISTGERLEHVRGRIDDLRDEQVRVAKRIAETKLRLAGRRRMLALRLRENYERGGRSYLSVLVRSRDVRDYMARSYYVEKIVGADIRLVSGIKADQRSLESDERRLRADEREQASLASELVSRTRDYQADKGRKQELLHDVHASREALEESLEVLEQASHEITGMIRAMMATPRGRARMLRPWTGSFIRPASGGITSSFGMRYHPILHRRKLHTGVDFGAGYGSPIHAAAAGEVIMAGYMRGYGNTVIIDHGGGVSTLYGHCSSIMVGSGSQVRQGQVIARVGSTGYSTGPHLHFEVRRNGVPVNPL